MQPSGDRQGRQASGYMPAPADPKGHRGPAVGVPCERQPRRRTDSWRPRLQFIEPTAWGYLALACYVVCRGLPWGPLNPD